MDSSDSDGLPAPDENLAADTTFHLLQRARGGDRAALNAMFARHIPKLRRWASGRLPRWARDLADTHDLVQDTVLQTFKRIMDAFEPRGEGALHRVCVREERTPNAWPRNTPGFRRGWR